MGFLNRVVPDGEALATAIALAGEIAVVPVAGRRERPPSVYAGLGLDLAEALAIEDELGPRHDLRRRLPRRRRAASTTTRPPAIASARRCSDLRGRWWRRWDRCGPAPGPRARAPRRWCASRRPRPAARPPPRCRSSKTWRDTRARRCRSPTASWNTARTPPTRRRSSTSPGPAEGLRLAAEVVLVRQRRERQQRRIALEVLRLHRVGHAPDVEPAVDHGHLHRADAWPAVVAGGGQEAEAGLGDPGAQERGDRRGVGLELGEGRHGSSRYANHP